MLFLLTLFVLMQKAVAICQMDYCGCDSMIQGSILAKGVTGWVCSPIYTGYIIASWHSFSTLLSHFGEDVTI